MADVQQGLEIMIIGLAVVFAALYGLSLVMELMARILSPKKEVGTVTKMDSDSKEELVAVISAVMAVVGVDKIGSIRIVTR